MRACRGRVGRRELLGGCLGLGVAGLTGAGCGSPPAAGLYGGAAAGDGLSYWNLFGGGDGERMSAIEQIYRRNHPDIRFEAVTFAWGNPYYTKLALAVRGGTPPDVAVAHATRITTLARNGLLDPLDTRELARHGMTADTFTTSAWQRCHVGDTLYGIPLDIHPYVLYYHTQVCRQAGLLATDGTLKPITGPDGLLHALRAIRKVTGEHAVVTATNSDPAMCWRLFATLYRQLGGAVTADDGTRIVLDNDKALTAMEFIKTLVQEGLMAPNVDDTGVPVIFSNGRAGFLFDGDWDVTIYLDNKTPFGMTGFPPVFGDRPICHADSHTFVLPHHPAPTPTRTLRALHLIRTILNHSDIWAQGGHIPTWAPVRDGPTYHAMIPQSSYSYVAYDEPAWYSGAGSNLEIFMGSAVAGIQQGRTTPHAALTEMRHNLDTYAAIPPPD